MAPIQDGSSANFSEQDYHQVKDVVNPDRDLAERR